MTLLNQFPYNHVDLVQAFFSTSAKKLKDEKTQNSSTKLKVSANLVKIIPENKGNKYKNEGQL